MLRQMILHMPSRFSGTVSGTRRLESRYLQLLEGSGSGAPKRIRYKAIKYILIGDDMFYRTLEGLLLKCLGPTEVNRLLHEVHEGQADFPVQFLELGDWRADIFNYLKDPAQGHLRGYDTRP
jgi:hypothetical protein